MGLFLQQIFHDLQSKSDFQVSPMVTYTKQIILTLHNTNNEGNQGEIICRNTKKGFESVPNLLKSGI